MSLEREVEFYGIIDISVVRLILYKSKLISIYLNYTQLSYISIWRNNKGVGVSKALLNSGQSSYTYGTDYGFSMNIYVALRYDLININ